MALGHSAVALHARPPHARPCNARRHVDGGVRRRRRERRRRDRHRRHRHPDAVPEPRAAAAQDASPKAGTPIRIMFGNTRLGARLDDNATARELAGRLPLRPPGPAHNGVEKTAPLPRPLATDGYDPAAGDIGYYAPAGDFVLYYDDNAPYFSGIVRIGEFQGDMEALRRLADGSTIMVHPAR